MYLHNCNINFNGLPPTDQTRSDVELTVQSLQNRSPSDSNIELLIISGENEVSGFLSVTSQEHKFESNKTGQSALSVVNLLNKDLLGQLNLWTQERKFCS